MSTFPLGDLEITITLEIAFGLPEESSYWAFSPYT